MRVNANAVLRSWTLLAAFGGSYAPGTVHVDVDVVRKSALLSSKQKCIKYVQCNGCM